VPVIKDADRKSIWMIADSIRDLAARGREGKLSPNEMNGRYVTFVPFFSAIGFMRVRNATSSVTSTSSMIVT
ncbi:hypothetical protein GNF82_18345, partial [Clostridium perfringens]